MSILRKLACVLPFLSFIVLAACSSPPQHGPDEVSRLAAGIRALGPRVDPEEADRAARIAISYPKQLAREYQVTDSPLIHNIKVNSGLRPRGLCWHWADDMQARLAMENFKTLELHRAIANADSAILIDHSTVIVSQRGDDMFDGMVLDPWRYGGVLYWSEVLEDKKYKWVPRQQVFAMRRANEFSKSGRAAALSPPEPLPENATYF